MQNIIEYSKVSKSNTLFFPKMYLFISSTYPDFNSMINSKKSQDDTIKNAKKRDVTKGINGLKY